MYLNVKITINDKNVKSAAECVARQISANYSDLILDFAGLREDDLIEALSSSKSFHCFIKHYTQCYGQSFLQCPDDYIDHILLSADLGPVIKWIPELAPVVDWLDECDVIVSTAQQEEYINCRTGRYRFISISQIY